MFVQILFVCLSSRYSLHIGEIDTLIYISPIALLRDDGEHIAECSGREPQVWHLSWKLPQSQRPSLPPFLLRGMSGEMVQEERQVWRVGVPELLQRSTDSRRRCGWIPGTFPGQHSAGISGQGKGESSRTSAREGGVKLKTFFASGYENWPTHSQHFDLKLDPTCIYWQYKCCCFFRYWEFLKIYVILAEICFQNFLQI